MKHLGSTITDANLSRSLGGVVSNAKILWQRGLIHHPDFTLHGIVHSEKISELLQTLSTHIPSPLSLNDKERFVLASSAYLHDIGMLFPLAGFIKCAIDSKPTLKTLGRVKCCETVIKDFCKDRKYKAGAYADEFFQDLERNPLPHDMREGEIIRHFHHLFSDSMIREHGEKLGLPRQATSLVATVSRGHRIVDLRDRTYRNTEWSGDIIRMGPLAALLRIADELDFSSERAPDILFEIFIEDLIQDPQSLKHWIRHFCVRSVGPVDFASTAEGHVQPIINIVADVPSEDYKPIIEEQMSKSLSQVTTQDVRECLQRIEICCPQVNLEINVDPSTTRLPMPLVNRIGPLKITEFLRQRKEDMVLEDEQSLIHDGFGGETLARMVGYKRSLYKVAYDCLNKAETKVTWEVHIQATQELSHVRHFFEQTDEPLELTSALGFHNLTPDRTISAVSKLTRGHMRREIDVTITPPLKAGEYCKYRFSEVYLNLFAHNKQSIDQKMSAGQWPFDEAVEALGSQVMVPTDELQISATLPEGIRLEKPGFRIKLIETIADVEEEKRLRKLKCLTIDHSNQRQHLSLVVPNPQLMVTYWLVWIPRSTGKEAT